MRSPRSADANLSRRFIRPSCERSRPGRMYHNLIDLRSDCGVSDCVDWRCSPKVGWRRPSTWVITLAWAVASLGCILTTVTKRCWRSSRGTSSSGPAIPNVFGPRDSRCHPGALPRHRQVTPRAPLPSRVAQGRPELPILLLPVFHGGLCTPLLRRETTPAPCLV